MNEMRLDSRKNTDKYAADKEEESDRYTFNTGNEYLDKAKADCANAKDITAALDDLLHKLHDDNPQIVRRPSRDASPIRFVNISIPSYHYIHIHSILSLTHLFSPQQSSPHQ